MFTRSPDNVISSEGENGIIPPQFILQVTLLRNGSILYTKPGGWAQSADGELNAATGGKGDENRTHGAPAAMSLQGRRQSLGKART